MAGTGFTWDPQAFIEAQTIFKGAHDSVVDVLTRLNTNMDSRLSLWNDTAKTAYYEHKKEWNDAASDMNDVLSHTSKKLGDTADAYDSAERQAKNKFTL